MRTVKNVEKVALSVSRQNLVNEKYVFVDTVSELLKEQEISKGLKYKSLREKFYNCIRLGKYSITVIYGKQCIDVTNPMMARASLALSFKVKEK